MAPDAGGGAGAAAVTAADAGIRSDFEQVLGEFRKFDADGNGTLGRGELGSLLQYLAPNAWSDEKVTRLFQAMDRNSDGAVQLEEFVSWVFADSSPNARKGLTQQDHASVDMMGAPSDPVSPGGRERPPMVTTRTQAGRRRLEAHYELGERIGEGGFGAVYRARNRSTGQPAAVKSVPKDSLSLLRRQGAASRLALSARPFSLAAGVPVPIGALDYPDDLAVRLDVSCRVASHVPARRTVLLRVHLRRGPQILHAADVAELVLMRALEERSEGAEATADRSFPTRDALVFRAQPGDVYEFELLLVEAPDDSPADEEPLACSLDFTAKLLANAQAREAVVLENLDHPGIVRMFDVLEDYRHIHLCMELCEGGDLFDFVLASGSLDEGGAASVLLQVCSAVRYMHCRRLMHRDLKLENMMLQRKEVLDRNVKLVDLGHARSFPAPGTFCSTKVGSAYYMSPQVVAGEYDEACDIWSLGVACHILLSGHPPFDGEDEMVVWARIRAGRVALDEASLGGASPEARDFVAGCLAVDPKCRLTVAAALEHRWLADLGRGEAPGTISATSFRNMRLFWEANQIRQLALCELAKRMDPDRAQELRALFERLDVDRTGELSYEELVQGLEGTDLGLGTGAEGWRSWLARTFGPEAGPASEGPRSISYTAFLASILDRRTLEEEAACWAAFRAFDRDGSGQISMRELGEVLRDSGLEAAMGSAAVQALRQEADADGDGQIDFWEFMEALRANKVNVARRRKSSFIANLPQVHKGDLVVKRSPLNCRRLCVESVRAGSGLHAWNQRQPASEAQLRPGDEIVSVNLVCSDVEKMLLELENGMQGLQLTLVRRVPGPAGPGEAA